MKLFLMIAAAVSVGCLMTACKTQNDDSLNGRLSKEYGWKGSNEMPGGVVGYESPTTRQRREAEEAAKAEAAAKAKAEIASKEKTTPKAAVKAPEKGDAPKVAVKAPGKGDAPKVAVKAPEKGDAPKAAVKVPEAVAQKTVAGKETIYVVKNGDSLWSIAKAHYKSGLKWEVIYEANKEALKGKANHLEAGMKLRIPAL